MADTNVRIQLSADGKQVRDEIKLIDRDLKELGNSSTIKVRGVTEGTSSNSPERVQTTSSTTQPADKTALKILKEMTLLRKELQRLNNSGAPLAGTPASSTPSTTPSASSNSASVPPPTTRPPSVASSGDTPGSNPKDKDKGELDSFLKRVGTALTAIGAVTQTFGAVNSAAKSSQSGMSLAYKTYGSTLAYTDYNQARKDASNLGAPYGYDYEMVLGAGSANMAKAGFTTLENYEADMNQLLKTSKAWGIDTSALAGASGIMTSIGVTESGEQKKFADLLAESIVQTEMSGRENEQLQVLETIADSLASNASSVSMNSLAGSLNLYSALVAQNENLKGMRGAQVVTSMQGLATSGNSSLDILAGFGTKYTGIAGKLQLRELAETSPEQYWKQVYQGYTQRYGAENKTNFTYFLSRQLGSVTKAEDVVASLGQVSRKDYDQVYKTLPTGEKATNARIQNYNQDKVSTFERKEVGVKEVKDDIGNIVNATTAPFWGAFNNLSNGWKTVLGVGASLGTSFGGAHMLSKGLFGKTPVDILGGLFGKGIKGTVTTGEGTTGVAAAANSVDDVAKAASTVKDATAIANSVGDVTKVASTANKLGKFSKTLGAVGIGLEVLSTGVDVNNAIKRKDYREAAQETGGGIGSIAGGFGGAAGGATAGAFLGSAVPVLGTAAGAMVGGIAGGVGGGLIGDYVGEFAGEKLYDWTSKPKTYSKEQKQQIQKYYNTVSALYNKQGNDAAQNYTNSVVVPYLRSIGVSKSITDAYKIDIGRSDFMKDFEGNVFGETSDGSYIENLQKNFELNSDNTVENTQAIQENTSAVNRLIEANSKTSAPLKETLQQASESNSKEESALGAWWLNLFKPHATGNDYIPYDNYLASLHKGEMVLNKFDADQYRQGSILGTSSPSVVELNVNISGSVEGMTISNQNQIAQAVVTQISKSGLQGMLSNGFVRVQNH